MINNFSYFTKMLSVVIVIYFVFNIFNVNIYLKPINNIILNNDVKSLKVKITYQTVKQSHIKLAILHQANSVLHLLVTNAIDLDLNNLLLFCGKNKKYQYIPYILQFNLDFFSKNNSNDDPLLHKIFFLKNEEFLMHLKYNGINLNMKNRIGDNLLGELFSRHSVVDMDLIDLAIKHGVDPYNKNDYDSSPLDMVYERDLKNMIISSYNKNVRKILDSSVNIPLDVVRIIYSYLNVQKRKMSYDEGEDITISFI